MNDKTVNQTTNTSGVDPASTPLQVKQQPYQPRPYNRHGMSHSATYLSWEGMIQHCFDPKHKSYHNYGGRGVTVCDRWKIFEAFLQDMGTRPEGRMLTRIDKNKPYSKDNCKWGTHKDVARNSRKSTYVTAFGETKSLAEWAEDPRCKVTYAVFKGRIRMGMNPELALTTAQKWQKNKPQPTTQAMAA